MSRIYTGVLVFTTILVISTLLVIINDLNQYKFKTRFKEVIVPVLEKQPLNVKINKPPPENVADFYFPNNGLRIPSMFNTSCAHFPLDLFNIHFQSDLWQTLLTPNGRFNVFNAYLDDRESIGDGGFIRILGAYNGDLTKNNKFYCQLWYNGIQQPYIVEVGVFHKLWNKDWEVDDNSYISYLLSCALPKSLEDRIPVSVSLVEKPCDNAVTNLKITYNEVREPKRDFVVCVKGLNFPFEDNTGRLVEWIELLRILGADLIHFYEFDVHPNVKRLLDYYIDEGFVEITPITLLGDVSNKPYLQNLFLQKKILQRRFLEVVPYNDCLYKHVYGFKYIVLQDVDEVIIPNKGTWRELLEKIKNSKITSYMARNVYFLDSFQKQHYKKIPRFLHMLQHVSRSAVYTEKGAYVKGFHDVDKVIALHNHFPFVCVEDCVSEEIALDLAHLQHYRPDCVWDVKNCDDMKHNIVEDTRIWNHKNELIESVRRVLADLGIEIEEVNENFTCNKNRNY